MAVANPCIVFGHGVRGQAAAARTMTLAADVELVRLGDEETIRETLESVCRLIPGNTRIRIVHIIDLEDEATEQVLERTADRVRGAFEGLPAVIGAQYIVAMVGNDWDDAEVARLAAAAASNDMSAPLVLARSTRAVALLDLDEEQVMASDVAYLVVINTNEALSDDGTVPWRTGATAVHYRPKVLVGAVTAHHVHEYLGRTLLQPLPALQEDCAAGEIFANRDRDLGSEQHRAFLDRSAEGKSLEESASVLGDGDEDALLRVPVEYLSDTLRSFALQALTEQRKAITDQVARNHTEHLAAELAALQDATRMHLERSKRLASAEEFLRCFKQSLGARLGALATDITAAEDAIAAHVPRMNDISLALEDAIRHLPYLTSVIARCLGVGAAGIGSWYLLASLLNPNFAVLGLLAGLAFAIPIFSDYLRRRARVYGLANEYLEACSELLRLQTALMVLRSARDEIERIGAETAPTGDTVGGRLAQLRATVEALDARFQTRIESRVFDALTPTRLSAILPSEQQLPLKELLDLYQVRFDEGSVMAILLPEPGVRPLDVDKADEELVVLVHSLMTKRPPDSLASLLNEFPMLENEIFRILGEDPSPIVRPGEASHLGDDSTHRYNKSQGHRSLQSRLDAHLTAQAGIPCIACNSLVRIAQRRVG